MHPQGPNSFNFMQFWAILAKIICWRPLEGWHPHLRKILDLPLLSDVNKRRKPFVSTKERGKEFEFPSED